MGIVRTVLGKLPKQFATGEPREQKEREVKRMKSVAVVGAMLLMVCPLVTADVTVGYLGHSCFTVQAEGGLLILIDPYADYLPYPGLPTTADVVLITHGHIDHCAHCYGQKDRVEGDPTVVWPFGTDGRVREGSWKIIEGLSVRFVEATHVTASGGGQGSVCLFSFVQDGIRFAHLGDLGRTLSEAQIAALGDVQVLLIPVGGAYTIDAAEAIAVVKQLPSVRVVIPMHYYVEGYCPWPDIAPVDGFLDLAIAEGWTVRESEVAELSLSAESLPDQAEVWTMTFAEK